MALKHTSFLIDLIAFITMIVFLMLFYFISAENIKILRLVGPVLQTIAASTKIAIFLGQTDNYQFAEEIIT